VVTARAISALWFTVDGADRGSLNTIFGIGAPSCWSAGAGLAALLDDDRPAFLVSPVIVGWR